MVVGKYGDENLKHLFLVFKIFYLELWFAIDWPVLPNLCNMLLCFLILLLNSVCDSFYVPGVAPVEFTKGTPIEVKAVKMTSTRTQLPYEYYSLPFCLPKNGIEYKSENLGNSYLLVWNCNYFIVLKTKYPFQGRY